MAKISSIIIIIIPFLIFFISSSTTLGSNAREALEIIIGGGGGNPAPPPENQDCPPPPPPPCPPPPSPPPPPPKQSRPPQPPRPRPQPQPRPRPRPRPRPPPSPFESERLKLVYPVLQAFRSKVLNRDPNRIITNTWKGTDICKYGGLKCDMVPDFKQMALAGVKLNNFNLPDVPLNGFVDMLPDIAFFHANSNNFTGTIPTNIGSLRYLFELDLSNNKLSGIFPNQVLRANQLVFLDLRFNVFAGLLPAQVFTLDLDLLFVNNNNFRQKLPDNLGSTPVLYLSLANNGFIGEIPHSIGKAANTLLEVLFLNNQLSGCLPYEIGLLKKATVFDVGSNMLTGPIPHSFQCLEKMELLNLAQNKFYGAVPEAVCSLPKLENFTLSYNYFTQVGPQCRKLIKDGVLHVRMNCILDLPNQRSPSDCRKFFLMPRYCPNEKSLSYVPCRKGVSQAIGSLESSSIETSDFESTTPADVPAPLTYSALSPSDR